jgi:hypothetical protein
MSQFNIDDSFDIDSLKSDVLNNESDYDDDSTNFTKANCARDETESNDIDNDDLNVLDDNSISVFTDSDSSVECLWEYRSGYAYNETQKEFDMFRFFLTLGRGRTRVYLSRIYSVSTNYIEKVSIKNNWLERIEAYDRQTLSNALSEEDNTRRKVHEEKLEIYRSQQETIANQSADNASKILHLIQRKLNKLVLDEDNLTIDELVSTGGLAVKLSQLQKELGSQALAVDALLEAIETDD